MRRIVYHLVDSSPWPFFIGLWMQIFFLFTFLFFQKVGNFLFFFLFITILLVWWRDVIRESTYLGFHTLVVKKNIYFRIIFFIISEIFFFLGFFWTFFHSSLSVVVDLIKIWPPIRVNTFNPLRIPLLNTVLLLSSRLTVTWSHYSLFKLNYKESVLRLIYTIFLRIIFTLLQIIEYKDCFFSFNDSIYRSIFFLRTRFHGTHVLVRTLILIVCFFRLIYRHFNINNQVRFECSIWYWHFVDVIWIFLYIIFYWWRS